MAFTCRGVASTALANGVGFGLALATEVKLRSTFQTRRRMKTGSEASPKTLLGLTSACGLALAGQALSNNAESLGGLS